MSNTFQCPTRFNVQHVSMSNANAAKNLRPHPEERVTKSGLPDFGNQGKHFSIRLTLTPLSSPGLTRSRACPTSALLNDRNRKHPISIGDPVNTPTVDTGLFCSRPI